MQNIHLIIYKERILKQKHFKIEEKKEEENINAIAEVTPDVHNKHV